MKWVTTIIVGDFKAGYGLIARSSNTADIYLIFNWKWIAICNKKPAIGER